MNSFRNCDELSKILAPTLELCEKHIGGIKGEYVYKAPENKDVGGLLRVLGNYATYVQTLPDYAPYRTIVLFIDEAQVLLFYICVFLFFKILGNLEKYDENQEALDGVFRWLESITKAQHSIHVFLASSDQFFYHWINTKLNDKFSTFQVVDLTKKQAELFFNRLKVELNLNYQLNADAFDNLYKLTGFFYYFFYFILFIRRIYVFH